VTDFFSTVLPATGTYCVVGIGRGRTRQSFHSTLEEVQDRVEFISGAGVDAYFALAAFTEDSRKAEHARSMRAFFLDIDCGPGKPYADHPEAALALREFVAAVELPEPLIVNSGGGLHVYWPFTEDIPIAQWLPAARALKALCVQHKLGIDLTVTADAARILRPPGTNNYKQERARPVQIVAVGHPTPFDALTAKLPPMPVDLSAARSFGTDSVTKDLLSGDRPSSSFQKIAVRSLKGTGCQQIKWALENQETLSEPLWRGALSIAWNCTDGATAIHKLSKRHPDYTPENTIAKAERTHDKPHTCEWFRANGEGRCGGCTQKVTSPIMLGRFVEATPTEEDGAIALRTSVETTHDGKVQFVDVKIPPLPRGYFRGAAGGIYIKRQDESGEDIDVEIYPHDLYVTDRYYDSDEHGDGDGELVAINVHLPQDGLRRFSAPTTSLMSTDKLRDVLVKHGVIVFGKQVGLIMAYIAAAITKLQTSTHSNRTRNQMGWTTEGTFVVGELEYTPAGIKLAPPASGTKQMAPLFHQKGTLDGWREVVDFYGRPGMELHAFALFAGAGSPLLQLLNNQQVRGAVVNLVSNGSGTGKTTVQMAINSMYGHPSELLMTQRDTLNAKFHNLGMLNSICMTVDEITNESPEGLSHLVYGATTGRAAHRMEAQSNKLRSNRTTWCTIMVTSSNAVISEALQAHKAASDGELKRVIDLHMPTPEGVVKEESDRVFRALGSNYGVAGPVFIQYVVANRAAIARELQALQAEIDGIMDMQRSERFYSSVLTCGILAGRIMRRLGLHNIDVDAVMRAACDAVRSTKEAASSAVGTYGTVALETLSKFITQNMSNTLVINSEAANGATIEMPKGPLRIRYEPDSKEMVIIGSELRSFFVSNRVDFRGSILAFVESGVLKLDSAGNPTTTRRPAAGAHGALKGAPCRCYVFDSEKLGLQPLTSDADTE
jgi:hypothetical protein